MVQENESIREMTHSTVLRKEQETAQQGEVGRSQQRRQTTRKREVEASGRATQHRQGTRAVRSDATTRGIADGTVSNGHRKKSKALTTT